MTKPHLLLDQLPVELIFNIFTYLSTAEILHSFYSFSRYLRKCIRNYDGYKVNLKAISKRQFDRIFRAIRPDQIVTLTLCDDEETPGQMSLFFTLFPAFEQSFIRLECLHIRNFEACPILHPMNVLHTISIDFVQWPVHSFGIANIQKFDEKFASIFRLPTLRTLILNKESVNNRFNIQILPTNENITQFEIHLRTIDNLSLLFKCFPNIQRLTFSLNTTSVDDDFTSEFRIPRSLTHLTMKVSFGLRDEIKRILQSCPMLIYLNIHIEWKQTDTLQWLDADWWQSIVEEFLPRLEIFRLQVDIPSSPELNITNDSLKGFQTQFWTNRSFTIGMMPFDPLSVDCRRETIENKVLTINLASSPMITFPNAEILKLEHVTNSETTCYVISQLVEIQRYMNDFSILEHLILQSACAVTSSVLTQLINVSPCLTRLTISSFNSQLHPLLNSKYPQIRWLDMRREYLPKKFRTSLCSAFPCLEHLMNCYLYDEVYLEILIENLKDLQNLTTRILSYYFEDDGELDHWLRTHTRLKNFAFKLIDHRQILLWISN
ncbi:unnamed protein product [Adineta ricciae]|uniref:F-box domain-containing protein n=1 Tax=Adineta ricciae TaxID=249248 RepID=A0A814IU70_ADIRI|nr:unnamed protein product [Adineta ricciae]